MILMASMNETPSGERLHIAFFGKRNAGKSSVINAVTGQNVSIVSDIKGTTTDPVAKAMEILPLGPVLLFDTPGFDDEGELGELRIKRTAQILDKSDVAVFVIDSSAPVSNEELDFINSIRSRNLDYIIVWNKTDLNNKISAIPNAPNICVSAKTGCGIEELKETLKTFAKKKESHPLVSDLLSQGDIVVLVTPIDASAPKGRLILPQQQVIRDIIDSGAMAYVCQPSTLLRTIQTLNENPRLVITDSQAFKEVEKTIPSSIPLTSFSILMARRKGALNESAQGSFKLDELNDGDKVLISEGCTHHRQCEDIGTVKLPRWILEYTKKKIDFVFSSGNDFPEDLTPYKMVIHCGGCMLNEREMKTRVTRAKSQGVAITNYGMAIAYMNGILKRSIEALEGKRK